jgi:hypothetical protein
MKTKRKQNETETTFNQSFRDHWNKKNSQIQKKLKEEIKQNKT